MIADTFEREKSSHPESRVTESSIQLALEAHSKQHGYDDVLNVRHCSAQDVLDTILRLECAYSVKGKATYKMRTRLMPLITFVDRYAQAVDTLVQTSTTACVNLAALVWRLLQINLEVASSMTKYFVSLLGLLEDLGSAVSLSTEFEDMFLEQPRYQRALVDIYMDIIAILGKVRKMLKKNDCGNDVTKSASKLFASLISQISSDIEMRSENSVLPSCLVEAYERSLKLGRPSISKTDSPEEILLELTSSLERTFLILDGLDEMENPKDVMETLLQVSSKSDSLQITFVSRDVPSIRKTLLELPRIEIMASDVEKDIDSYIQAQSKNLPIEGGQAKDDIIREISTKAEGMFLWVNIVLESLCNTKNLTQLREMLRQFSTGLNTIYEHFLLNLAQQAPHRRNLAKGILHWVCCATRLLTVEELQFALSPSASQDQVHQEQKSFRSTILDLCSPLVVVTPDTNHIRLTHHSIRDYIFGNASFMSLNEPKKVFLTSEQEANTELATRCLEYVRMRAILPATTEVEFNGLRKYAMVSWCHHVVRSSYRADLGTKIVTLMSSSERRQIWLFHVLFQCNESYPFQRIFQLQKELAVWIKSSAQRSSSLTRLVATDWSLDALELLMKLDISSSHDSTSRAQNNLNISYFERMLVVRDLARRLDQNSLLCRATTKLEEYRMASKTTQKMARLSCLLNTLGILYDQQGARELSLHTHFKALSEQESQLGHEHPETLWTLNELGRTYRHLGILEESKKIHERVLARLKLTLPEDHPELVWTINTLATTLRKQGHIQDALHLHLKAYHARSKSLGANHPHTLLSCDDIAKCYRDQAQFHNSLSWYQKVVRGRIEVLGPENPDTLRSLNGLGAVLVRLGRYFEAIETQSRALEAQQRVLGKDHKHTERTRKLIDSLNTLQLRRPHISFRVITPEQILPIER
ncbi:MAG: hypothetical protein Q9165_007943 [Trypethelium subeluteriae]